LQSLHFKALAGTKNSIGPVRFAGILEPLNPELDLGFGSVHDPPPNLNSGPVRVRFRFGIGSEPNTGNTSQGTGLCPKCTKLQSHALDSAEYSDIKVRCLLSMIRKALTVL
jgi:hypothetical protein